MTNHVEFTHDVFLSFRGGTRYSFTDHLFRSLLRHGINVFRDDQNLNIGDEIGPSLLQAIEASRISVVVLCKDYASSSWCLDELVKIVDCCQNNGKSIFVIFYKIEPSVVRQQKNSYEIAMKEHENRFGSESEKVKAWRFALNRVCTFCGLHYKDDTYESEFIDKIVRNISAKLPPMPLQTKHLVGLDSRFEQVKSLIDIDSVDSVCMLGICGGGGIGKTTFAMDIYNKIRHRFEAGSFLANVREKSNASTSGLGDLQRTLLSEMGAETQTMMGSTFRGSSEIKRRLSHKRVLLVLDDVDSVKQLDTLAGGHDWFGSGSRIIITTRDEDVLHKHDVKTYKLEELNYDESIELFCWYAFNMSKPAENFENISSRAINYAKGIPLALKVIGSNLKGKSIEEWDIELQKYKKVPDVEIQGVLEISYKSLSDLDQKVFLDIACFFKGERWDYVKRVLDACDFYPIIRVFVNKCLITVDENGCLEMHDLIQDMGREIVRKESVSNPGKRSRLWSHKDVLAVLKGNMGSSTVEGIMLHPPKQEKVDNWAYTAFKKMKNLRILIVRNTLFLSGPDYLPNSLRLLDWKCFPSKNFPPDFYPYRIVDFKLPHCSMILKKPFQSFEDLTFINLKHSQSITQIPDLSGAKNLRMFTLDKCRKLVRFDISIGFMPNLVYLSVSGCTELKCFVPKMYLPSLQELSFNLCEKLEYFPHVMQKMDKSLKIQMINTAVKEFPKSIGNLTGLHYIDMSHCKGVKDLSSSFLLLPKLLTLKIDGCSQLGASFQRFKDHHSGANGYPNLETLHFSESNLSYEDVDAIIECFPKLTDLKVSHNEFIALPKCITGSLHLKSLDVSFCNNLTEIPELPSSIQNIDARHCQSLTTEASSLLWSKVRQEIQRIQVVMPMLKREIPKWFDRSYSEGIPIILARRKFPIVALALVLQEVKKTTDDFPSYSDKLILLAGIKKFYIISLHLFIDGQEFCSRDLPNFNVGEDHVLLCDLRVLFSDEEWQNLDASLGDDWKTIQVQFVLNLKGQDFILTNWGVYVYRHETSINNIQFVRHNLIEPFSHMLSSQLVRHRSYEQYMKCILNSFKFTDMLKADSILRQSDVDEDIFSIAVCRFWINVKAEITDEASSSLCGASLKQDHEDSTADVVQVLEMLKENVPKHIAEHECYQFEDRFVESILTAYVKWGNTLYIRMPIVLVDTSNILGTSHRYWGNIHIKLGDPVFKSVLSRFNDYPFRFATRAENLATVLVLKCHPEFEEEASSSSIEESLEEEYYDPVFEEFMRRIEQDAMSLNKHYGKMKASIVQFDEQLFFGRYENEEFLFKILTRNRFIRWATMFGSPFKLKFKPYGMIRSEEESLSEVRMLIWLLCVFLNILIELSYGCTHRILVWGWLLVKTFFVSCKKVYRIVEKNIMRIKKKEL